MAEPGRRGRFQVHLSTAVVMMFVAGGLIWANTRVNESTDLSGLFEGSAEKKDIVLFNERGFPFTCYVSIDYIIHIDPREGMGLAGTNEDVRWTWWKACINLFVAFSLIFTVRFFSEWLIRRRANGSVRHE